jgi:hypothetical protein
MLAEGVLVLMLATAPGSPALASGFSSPEPGMLEQLRRRHRPGQMLRVTSGLSRLELHANDLDERGLAGLTARRGASLPPDPLPWSNIERIDVVSTRQTYGTVTGAILGGLAGMIVPSYPNGYSTQKPHQVRDYFFAGALVGGLIGRYMGNNVSRERPLYVAPAPRRVTAPAAPIAAVPDPARSHAAVDSVATGAPVAPAIAAADSAGAPSLAAPPNPAFDAGPPGPYVQSVKRRIDSGRLLRIDGTFGRFHGYASQTDNQGLSGLRTEPTLESVAGIRELRWKEIDRIQVRGGTAGSGAIKGGLMVGGATGLLGVMLGLAIDSIGGGQAGPGAAVAGGAIGFLIGAPVGALIGAAVGAGGSSWHTVYTRQ